MRRAQRASSRDDDSDSASSESASVASSQESEGSSSSSSSSASSASSGSSEESSSAPDSESGSSTLPGTADVSSANEDASLSSASAESTSAQSEEDSSSHSEQVEESKPAPKESSLSLKSRSSTVAKVTDNENDASESSSATGTSASNTVMTEDILSSKRASAAVARSPESKTPGKKLGAAAKTKPVVTPKAKRPAAMDNDSSSSATAETADEIVEAVSSKKVKVNAKALPSKRVANDSAEEQARSPKPRTAESKASGVMDETLPKDASKATRNTTLTNKTAAAPTVNRMLATDDDSESASAATSDSDTVQTETVKPAATSPPKGTRASSTTSAKDTSARELPETPDLGPSSLPKSPHSPRRPVTSAVKSDDSSATSDSDTVMTEELRGSAKAESTARDIPETKLTTLLQSPAKAASAKVAAAASVASGDDSCATSDSDTVLTENLPSPTTKKVAVGPPAVSPAKPAARDLPETKLEPIPILQSKSSPNTASEESADDSCATSDSDTVITEQQAATTSPGRKVSFVAALATNPTDRTAAGTSHESTNDDEDDESRSATTESDTVESKMSKELGGDMDTNDESGEEESSAPTATSEAESSQATSSASEIVATNPNSTAKIADEESENSGESADVPPRTDVQSADGNDDATSDSDTVQTEEAGQKAAGIRSKARLMTLSPRTKIDVTGESSGAANDGHGSGRDKDATDLNQQSPLKTPEASKQSLISQSLGIDELARPEAVVVTPSPTNSPLKSPTRNTVRDSETPPDVKSFELSPTARAPLKVPKSPIDSNSPAKSKGADSPKSNLAPDQDGEKSPKRGKLGGMLDLLSKATVLEAVDVRSVGDISDMTEDTSAKKFSNMMVGGPSDAVSALASIDEDLKEEDSSRGAPELERVVEMQDEDLQQSFQGSKQSLQTTESDKGGGHILNLNFEADEAVVYDLEQEPKLFENDDSPQPQVAENFSEDPTGSDNRNTPLRKKSNLFGRLKRGLTSAVRPSFRKAKNDEAGGVSWTDDEKDPSSLLTGKLSRATINESDEARDKDATMLADTNAEVEYSADDVSPSTPNALAKKSPLRARPRALSEDSTPPLPREHDRRRSPFRSKSFDSEDDSKHTSKLFGFLRRPKAKKEYSFFDADFSDSNLNAETGFKLRNDNMFTPESASKDASNDESQNVSNNASQTPTVNLAEQFSSPVSSDVETLYRTDNNRQPRRARPRKSDRDGPEVSECESGSTDLVLLANSTAHSAATSSEMESCETEDSEAEAETQEDTIESRERTEDGRAEDEGDENEEAMSEDEEDSEAEAETPHEIMESSSDNMDLEDGNPSVNRSEVDSGSESEEHSQAESERSEENESESDGSNEDAGETSEDEGETSGDIDVADDGRDTDDAESEDASENSASASESAHETSDSESHPTPEDDASESEESGDDNSGVVGSEDESVFEVESEFETDSISRDDIRGIASQSNSADGNDNTEGSSGYEDDAVQESFVDFIDIADMISVKAEANTSRMAIDENLTRKSFESTEAPIETMKQDIFTGFPLSMDAASFINDDRHLESDSGNSNFVESDEEDDGSGVADLDATFVNFSETEYVGTSRDTSGDVTGAGMDENGNDTVLTTETFVNFSDTKVEEAAKSKRTSKGRLTEMGLALLKKPALTKPSDLNDSEKHQSVLRSSDGPLIHSELEGEDVGSQPGRDADEARRNASFGEGEADSIEDSFEKQSYRDHDRQIDPSDNRFHQSKSSMDETKPLIREEISKPYLTDLNYPETRQLGVGGEDEDDAEDNGVQTEKVAKTNRRWPFWAKYTSGSSKQLLSEVHDQAARIDLQKVNVEATGGNAGQDRHQESGDDNLEAMENEPFTGKPHPKSSPSKAATETIVKQASSWSMKSGPLHDPLMYNSNSPLDEEATEIDKTATSNVSRKPDKFRQKWPMWASGRKVAELSDEPKDEKRVETSFLAQSNASPDVPMSDDEIRGQDEDKDLFADEETAEKDAPGDSDHRRAGMLNPLKMVRRASNWSGRTGRSVPLQESSEASEKESVPLSQIPESGAREIDRAVPYGGDNVSPLQEPLSIPSYLESSPEESSRNGSKPVRSSLNKKPGYARCSCGLCVVIALAIVGLSLGVAIAYVLSQGNSERNVVIIPSPSPVQNPPPDLETVIYPTMAPIVNGDIYELLCSVMMDCSQLLNETASQGRAFEWLVDPANNPGLDSFSSDKKITRYALASFFYSTLGEAWVNNENWMTQTDECEWFTSSTTPVCSQVGDFMTLALENIGLQGEIPSDVGLLTSLTTLSLQKPNTTLTTLRGRLSSFISGLSKLTSLALSGASLEGGIPTEIEKLTLLEILDLSGNDLRGDMPDSMKALSNLQYLRLRHNKLTGGIQSELLSVASNLVELDLEGNVFTSVPDTIADLSSLRRLNLRSNELITFPLVVSRLSNLEFLDASLNGFGGPIPSDLGNLMALRELHLSGNDFTGSIPVTIGNLRNLNITLDLSTNRLSGSIPIQLSQLMNLQRLYLNSNKLIGGIPSELVRLSRITTIRLDGNDLTGTVPTLLCSIYDVSRPVSYADCDELQGSECFSYCCTETGGCVCRFEGTDFERCLTES
jgi:Leucine-rich repeat (LRR) protein